MKTSPTQTTNLDQSLTILQENKDRWAATPVREKISLLERVLDGYIPLCEKWVALSLNAKRAAQDAYARGWEWASGPMPVLRYLRGLQRTFMALQETGQPPLPYPLVTRPNGQLSVRVYPVSLYDRFSTSGTTVEVWMEPGLGAEEVFIDQPGAHSQSQVSGKVCLVLGAGNVAGIPFNDALSKLFVDQCVVLLKMSPVNEYLGPLIETAFSQLIAEGFFRLVYGGADEGAYLTKHPGVDCIHITGSDKTYEAIAFGVGAEGRQRKQERRPVCTKPLTAELGNIGPAIVVPGPWSKSDIHYQAEQLASHLCDSASYSCSRTRLIIQHSSWQHRHELLKEIENVLQQVPLRAAYYPGADELYQRFVEAHPEAIKCGSGMDGKLPWTLIPGVDPQGENDICFTTEAFCPVMSETVLEASSPADFVLKAVDFINQRVWGSLTALIIVHPQSLRDPEVAEGVEEAIERLRYGTVAINSLPSLVWGIATPPWGSHPGNEPWNIRSGNGFVHNTLLFSHPQKTVLRGPFRTYPLPPWFPSRAERMGEICRNIARYEAEPTTRRMLEVIVSAIK